VDDALGTTSRPAALSGRDQQSDQELGRATALTAEWGQAAVRRVAGTEASGLLRAAARHRTPHPDLIRALVTADRHLGNYAKREIDQCGAGGGTLARDRETLLSCRSAKRSGCALPSNIARC